eukprot:31176-Pelagococcus_subviridis.AAC.28
MHATGAVGAHETDILPRSSLATEDRDCDVPLFGGDVNVSGVSLSSCTRNFPCTMHVSKSAHRAGRFMRSLRSFKYVAAASAGGETPGASASFLAQRAGATTSLLLLSSAFSISACFAFFDAAAPGPESAISSKRHGRPLVSPPPTRRLCATLFHVVLVTLVARHGVA